MYYLGTKNKETRGLVLHGPALDLLKEKRVKTNQSKGLIFPSSKNPDHPFDFKRPFQMALKKANIEDFTWHDIRHTTASYLAMQGASPSEIASVLGHKSLDMVKRYSHISRAHTSEVLRKLNQSLF